MFSLASKIVNEFKPIKAVGTLRHVSLWVSSSSKDVTYRNPNFSESKAEPREIAIYCVHGTADRSGAFSKIAKRLLESKDFPNRISAIHSLSFDGRGEGSNIEAFAGQLATKILANKHQDVILMGHSRGGLVISYFTEYMAQARGINVHAVIPICTPFKGSPFAFKLLSILSASVDQMAQGSMFLSQLSQRIEKSKAKYFYFAVKDDFLVPHDAAYVIAPNSSIYLLEDKHNHLSVMASKTLVEILLLRLESVTLNLIPTEVKEQKPAETKQVFSA